MDDREEENLERRAMEAYNKEYRIGGRHALMNEKVKWYKKKLQKGKIKE